MRRTIGAFLLGSMLLAMPLSAPAVVGGSPAGEGEYPWMAAVYTGSSPRGFYCGGSLVAPTVVVTAAHCVFELIDNTVASLPVDLLGLKVKVAIGLTDVRTNDGERITATRLTAHPDPDVDIAVLELATASSFSPIPWATSDDIGLYPDGTVSAVAGWGATSEGGNVSDVLLEASVPIVGDGPCSSAYPGQIDPSAMVCAGYPDGGTDTCQGDSGGPLMIPDGGGMLLIGVTSWGDGCARPGKPGVYAEVAAASAFIDSFVA